MNSRESLVPDRYDWNGAPAGRADRHPRPNSVRLTGGSMREPRKTCREGATRSETADLNRRVWLGVTGIGLARAAWPVDEPPIGSRTPTRFQIACMTLPYSQFPLQRALTGIKAAGYQYVAWGTTHVERARRRDARPRGRCTSRPGEGTGQAMPRPWSGTAHDVLGHLPRGRRCPESPSPADPPGRGRRRSPRCSPSATLVEATASSGSNGSSSLARWRATMA